MTHGIGLEQRAGEPGEGTGVGVRTTSMSSSVTAGGTDYAGLPARRQAAGGAARRNAGRSSRLAYPTRRAISPTARPVSASSRRAPHPPLGDPLLDGSAVRRPIAVVRWPGVSPTASATSRSEIGSWGRAR